MKGTYDRLLIENILTRPHGFDWSVQGLGMMRMYLSQAVRLHIWDGALRVPGVSAIHSHPWDLQSRIVAGRYKQHRYQLLADNATHTYAEQFNVALIQCGEHAGVVEEPTKLYMIEMPLEIYAAGEGYLQSKEEIHLSLPDDGTVTLVERTFHEDRDHARVYWRGAGGWVDAKPREATKEEVEEITQRALRTWF